MKHPYSTIKQRHRLQWVYACITIIVLALGWKFPILGFLVLGAMVGGMISGPIAGRWFCGNLCPRGGFLERVISLYSRGKKAPSWLSSKSFRIGVICFLMVMITLNVSQDPLNWRQWGLAFWTICLVTTGVGAVLAIFWDSRSWCTICPMGTIQNWVGGDIYHLEIYPKVCISCLKCEKSCPMKLKIIHPKTKDTLPAVLASRDCIRCGECIAACPTKTLQFASKKQACTSPCKGCKPE